MKENKMNKELNESELEQVDGGIMLQGVEIKVPIENAVTENNVSPLCKAINGIAEDSKKHNKIKTESILHNGLTKKM